MFRVLKRAELEKDSKGQNEATLSLLGPIRTGAHESSAWQFIPSSHHELGPSNERSPAISSPASFGSQLCTSRAEVAGLPSESLADAPRDSYSRGQRNLDTGAGEVDMEVDFAIPMDEDEDKF